MSTNNQWPFKRCSGAHCHVHDDCAHHALPTNGWADGLVYPPHPIYKSDDCNWFAPKDGWGNEPEIHHHD